MAPKPAPKGGGGGLNLSKKVGPLPLWAWIAIGAAGIAAGLYLRHRLASQSAATSNSDLNTMPYGTGTGTTSPDIGTATAGGGGSAGAGASGIDPATYAQSLLDAYTSGEQNQNTIWEQLTSQFGLAGVGAGNGGTTPNDTWQQAEALGWVPGQSNMGPLLWLRYRGHLPGGGGDGGSSSPGPAGPGLPPASGTSNTKPGSGQIATASLPYAPGSTAVIREIPTVGGGTIATRVGTITGKGLNTEFTQSGGAGKPIIAM
jgi:hypothetical protein